MAKAHDDAPAPAKAPAPEARPGARRCEPTDRAEGGLRRFKLRLDGHPSGFRSQCYVLAATEPEAKACYLESEKVDPTEVDGKGVKLVVTALPD